MAGVNLDLLLLPTPLLLTLLLPILATLRPPALPHHSHRFFPLAHKAPERLLTLVSPTSRYTTTNQRLPLPVPVLVAPTLHKQPDPRAIAVSPTVVPTMFVSGARTRAVPATTGLRIVA